MTIYELEKQASTIPWEVRENLDGCYDESDTVICVPVGLEVLRVGEVRPNVSSKHHEANTAMAVHCRNNFLKALEALKDCARDIVHDEACKSRLFPDGECTCHRAELRALIKELEEVEE